MVPPGGKGTEKWSDDVVGEDVVGEDDVAYAYARAAVVARP
jgi:hypothetical protein